MPRNHHSLALFATTIFWLIGVSYASAQSIDIPTADPAAVSVNATAKVVVRAAVSGQNLIPGSVNVQLVDASDRPLAVLGTLNDNGVDGDAIAGDGIYSGTITINQSTPGAVRLRVSAARLGSLTRVTSSPIAIAVLPAGVPTAAFATDISQTVVDPTTGNYMLANEFDACFAETLDASVVASIAALVHGTLVGRLSELGNCYQIQLPSGSTATTVKSAVATVAAQSGVTFAEPEFLETPQACTLPTCSDPSYQILRLNDAHTVSTGKGVTIAVVDSGLSQVACCGLLSSVSMAVPGHNFTTDGASSDTNDTSHGGAHDGHGTLVTGIVAATAPGAAIVPLKACSFDAGAKPPDTLCSPVLKAAAVNYAVNAHVVRVINISSGGYVENKAQSMAIENAFTHRIVVAAAAGNDNSTKPFFPAASAGALSVAATNVRSKSDSSNSDTIASFSNHNPTVEISAPGVAIATTDFLGSQSPCSGTSCSAPLVTGTAALVFQQHPTWSSVAVQNQLVNSAQPIYLWNASNMIVDQQIGPRLDPLAAVGGVRVTEIGFDHIQLHLRFGFGAQTLATNDTFLGQGTQFGDTTPCEVRANLMTGQIIQPCVRDYIVTPKNGQQYQLFFQLQDTVNADFSAYIDLTLPGLTFVPGTNSSNASIVDNTRALITLFGFAGGHHAAVINVQYTAQ